jgi:hypothetical protein
VTVCAYTVLFVLLRDADSCAHLRRPKRCSHTIVSFLRLFASGTYVNTANSRTKLKI